MPNLNFHRHSNPPSPAPGFESKLDDSLASISNIIGLSPGVVRPLVDSERSNSSFAPISVTQPSQQYWDRMGGTSTPPRSPAPIQRLGSAASLNSQSSLTNVFGSTMNLGGSQHKKQQQGPAVPEKPSFSFPCLIGLALTSCESGRMSVSQIYDYITTRFPYFKTAKAGWKNSVRHNLSLNKFFCKLERKDDEQGKGSMWGIVPENKTQLLRDIETYKNRQHNSRRTSVPASPAPKPFSVTRVNSAPVMNVPTMKMETDSLGPLMDSSSFGMQGVSYGMANNASRRLSLPAQVQIPVGIPEEPLFNFSETLNDLLDSDSIMLDDTTNSLLQDESTMTAWIGGTSSSPNSDGSQIDIIGNNDFDQHWQYLTEDLNYMNNPVGDSSWAMEQVN